MCLLLHCCENFQSVQKLNISLKPHGLSPAQVMQNRLLHMQKSLCSDMSASSESKLKLASDFKSFANKRKHSDEDNCSITSKKQRLAHQPQVMNKYNDMEI